MAQGDTSAEPRLAAFALGLGVFAVASSALIARQAQAAGVAAHVLAAGRLGIGALGLGAMAWWQLRAVPRSSAAGHGRRQGVLASALWPGLWLALHFGTWLRSLELTSVALSAVLVATAPLWVVLLEWLWLRRRPSRAACLGTGLATLGAAWMLAAGGGGGRQLAFGSGELLALAGGLALAVHWLLCARRPASVAFLPWLACTYGVAALVAIGLAWMLDESFAPLSLWSGAWPVLAMGLGPQLLGHSAFQVALRSMAAHRVAVASLAEPVLASLMAWLLLAERPLPQQLVGAGILLLGVGWALRRPRAVQVAP